MEIPVECAQVGDRVRLGTQWGRVTAVWPVNTDNATSTAVLSDHMVLECCMDCGEVVRFSVPVF